VIINYSSGTQRTQQRINHRWMRNSIDAGFDDICPVLQNTQVFHNPTNAPHRHRIMAAPHNNPVKHIEDPLLPQQPAATLVGRRNHSQNPHDRLINHATIENWTTAQDRNNRPVQRQRRRVRQRENRHNLERRQRKIHILLEAPARSSKRAPHKTESVLSPQRSLQSRHSLRKQHHRINRGANNSLARRPLIQTIK
jgi:hypothetical protein